MTKKDYIAIAKAIREVAGSGEANQLTVRAIVQNIADVLGDDNPRFNHTTFAHAATGVLDLSGTNYLARIGAR